MTITSLDDAAWDSPWRRRPVGEKVALSTALLLTALCTPSMEASRWVRSVVGSGIWPGALLAGIVSVIVVLGPARIAGRVLWQAVVAPARLSRHRRHLRSRQPWIHPGWNGLVACRGV